MMKLTETLSAEVPNILKLGCKVIDRRIVPTPDDSSLADGAAKLIATVLSANLTHASALSTEFQQRTAAKVVRAFSTCMSRLIEEHQGVVTGFDGVRVMGVFLGDDRNSNAATCALKMNYAVREIISPSLAEYYESYREAACGITHCVGIDTSAVLAVSMGSSESNSLAIIGRATEIAARLSEIRTDPYGTYVSEDVYLSMSDHAKYGAESKRPMWEQVSYSLSGEDATVFRSSWQWKP